MVTSGKERADLLDGYQPISLTPIFRLSELVRYQRTNSSASFGCFVPPTTEMAEPPQGAVTLPPAVHCGSEATDHLPDWCAALPLITPCPHTADGQLAILPLSRPAFQSFEKSATVATRPLSTRPCQKLATFFEASLLMVTFQESP